MSYSPDGEHIAIMTEEYICVVNSDSKSVFKRYMIGSHENENFLKDFVWTADSREIITSYFYRVWERQDPNKAEQMLIREHFIEGRDIETGATSTRTFKVEGVGDSLRPDGLSLSPDGKHLAIGYGTREGENEVYGVYITNSSNFETIKNIVFTKKTFNNNGDFIPKPTFSPDGKYMSIGGKYTNEEEHEIFYSTNDFQEIHSQKIENREWLNWIGNGDLAQMDFDDGSIRLYSFEQKDETLMLVKKDTFSLKSILEDYAKENYKKEGYGLILHMSNEFKFSDDGKYIAIGGHFSPDTYSSDKKFMAVFSTENRSIAFFDVTDYTYATYYDWSPDGKLAYIFSKEGIENLEIAKIDSDYAK